ncbi:VENN motif pre-toxin domain-containing protein [Pantoea agglomerans]|jgi:filamentous hemagglutinin|nr:VENN motif pre-toxin domain-containing protein [Pantoea agglomerans]EZI34325.1 Filamentous hemagglutinin [Pantoea agglomerans]WVL84079.1 VENN motif pre-toxin domain-containing protein [Pantoea agglomerans]
MVKGDLPVSANIIKAILENNPGSDTVILAEQIHKLTTTKGPDGKEEVNVQANLIAHAVVGAVTSYASGNPALAGASGAAMGEYIAQQMYPGVKREDLSEEQRQTISALGTLAAGLAGGVAGDSTGGAVAGAQAGKNAVENNWLHVNEKTEFEIARQKLRSNDPAEREQAQQKINDLREKNISRDKKVTDACGNGRAATPACASARLEAYSVKGEYETGNYNNKVSDMYPDAYGQIVNLLNITSVDAQNQQQVKDAMVNYAMEQLRVDKTTAEQYVSTYDGMKIVAASMSPVLGTAAANKLSAIVKEANIYPSGISFKIDQPEHLAQLAGYTQKKGITGAHNANAFYDAVKKNNVKIVSETPTGTKGITQIEYQIPAKDREGNIIGLKNNGAEPFKKTIYDPNIFTDEKMLQLGQEAAAKGYKVAIAKGQQSYDATAGGVAFRVYINKDTGLVNNFHPK